MDYTEYKDIDVSKLDPDTTISILESIIKNPDIVSEQKLHAIGLVLDQNKENYVNQIKNENRRIQKDMQQLLTIKEVGDNWQYFQDLIKGNKTLLEKNQQYRNVLKSDKKELLFDLDAELKELNMSAKQVLSEVQKIKNYTKLKNEYKTLLKMMDGKYVTHYQITEDDISGLNVEVELEQGFYLKNLAALRKSLQQEGKRSSGSGKKAQHLSAENQRLTNELNELKSKLPKKKVIVVKKKAE